MPRPMEEGKRSFKLVDASFKHDYSQGKTRYTAFEPAVAGKNAGKILLQRADRGEGDLAKYKNASTVLVKIEETTRASAGKVYFYKVSKTRLPNAKPHSYQGEDGKKKTFTAKWAYTVTHIDEADFKRSSSKRATAVAAAAA